MEFDLELRHIARLSNSTAGLALIIFLICGWAVAQESVTSILQKSVEANDRDWKAAPQYDYFERDRDPQGTKTYSVTNVLGSPYEKLVAINDKELDGSKKSEEQRKFEQMESKRRAESPQQRAKRISSYEADRRRDHEM